MAGDKLQVRPDAAPGLLRAAFRLGAARRIVAEGAAVVVPVGWTAIEAMEATRQNLAAAELEFAAAVGAAQERE